jgi:hypothetical protein
MMRCVPLLSALVFALGCSGTATMDHEQLASERKRLRSLDAEALLFDQVAARRHATTTFERAHAVYLHRGAREVVQKLGKARPAPGAEAEFQQVSGDATRLEQRFIALLLRFP